MTTEIKKTFFVTSIVLIFSSNFSFAGVTIGQEIARLKARISELERKVGPGIPAVTIDNYIKTGDCTALTTQPADACTVSGTCYDTDSFVDSGANSLLGYTFTAVKSTADSTDKDGGIWLCDSTDLSTLSSISQCTSIGGNRRDGSGTVEFTIPVGAANKQVYALSMNALGVLSANSALTSISVCKKASSIVAINP